MQIYKVLSADNSPEHIKIRKEYARRRVFQLFNAVQGGIQLQMCDLKYKCMFNVGALYLNSYKDFCIWL